MRTKSSLTAIPLMADMQPVAPAGGIDPILLNGPHGLNLPIALNATAFTAGAATMTGE